jgi:hypothetical protein
VYTNNKRRNRIAGLRKGSTISPVERLFNEFEAHKAKEEKSLGGWGQP